MRVVMVRIQNYRCIKHCEFFPTAHNCLLGPNNSGKTAILEAVNLLLNPEITHYTHAIDENDFFGRNYASVSGENVDGAAPIIRVEAVLSDLSSDDEDCFRDNLVPWQAEDRTVIESTPEGTDPFAAAQTAIRVVFEGWYDASEDDFFYDTFFLRSSDSERDNSPKFTREHKRHVGFLIYRDFRALTRPTTLEPQSLFGVLLNSQDAKPTHFEVVLSNLSNVLDCLLANPNFETLLSSYQSEIERFLSLSSSGSGELSFRMTDGTRDSLKKNSQLHVSDMITLPFQQMGAGTRSLATLAILTLIMRRRGRGILALEEPETFLFPHAQRRVLDECLGLADQTFVTTHSPYVLERIPQSGVGRVVRSADGSIAWSPMPTASITQINHYSRTLHQAQCEALVGQGVIVVEGESDRWWVMGASRILNRHTEAGIQFESLELLGVCVVAAEGNGGIKRYGEFFRSAGLRVFGLYDLLPEEILGQTFASDFPSLQMKYLGLEDLLVAELPITLLKQMLIEAPYYKGTLLPRDLVSRMNAEELKESAMKFLKDNKGTRPLHEWLIASLDETTLPKTFVHIIAQSMKYFLNKTELCFATVLSPRQ